MSAISSTMKRRGSPTAISTPKRTRVSQSVPSDHSVPNSGPSSHATTKHFESANVDLLRKSPWPWEIWSDDIPGAEVFYLPNFLDETTVNGMYRELEGLDSCK